ncbi:T9SS type A sorting domain-containing protein [Flavobacterium stagni]|uniref:T9SS type A sorting domain-containing protein n=1 Tax=Flavobacterium stagni TaxID=2506421 RepID=A0A4Q1K997_9FLAO|nr:T9SS type A sorting domain-containing protein [Flavobacterium stagni]RXR22640.1 T9SS type A sorting domain-containing protein [Flavobacterium stagni]
MKPLVFVFAFISLITNSQTLTPVYPSSGFSGNAFGKRVALDDNNHLFATTQNTSFNAQKGAIYRFDYTSGNAVQTNFYEVPTLTAEDDFAYSLDVNQNFVVAGAPGKDGSVANSGSVYVFENSTPGTLVQTLTAPNPAAEDQFGKNIHLLGNFLFVSQVTSLSGNAGSVYVYQFNGTAYTFVQQITAPGTPYFGSKIWTHNNRIYIGNGNLYYTSGDFQSLKAYDWNGNSWIENTAFNFTNTSANVIKDFAFHNDNLLVLTNDYSDNYLTRFVHDGSMWTNSATMNLNYGDSMVNVMKIEGDFMAIGTNNYVLQMERKFPLRFYQYANNTWNLTLTLYGQGPDLQDDAFGSVIAMNNTGLAIGSPQENNPGPYDGKAYYVPFSSLGNPTFLTATLNIAPNPAHEYIQITADFNYQKLALFDVSGKSLAFSTENGRIPITHLENGMYILQATDENGKIFTTKFLKN